MHADLILHNLKVMPGLVPCAAVDILAIRGNKIAFLGTKDALEWLRGPGTRMLDCRGGLVLPGFNDAHCHPVALAVTKRYVDCAAEHIGRIGDLQAELRKKAAASERAGWIRGANLDAARLAENRPPTRQELDAAVPGLPVVLIDRAGQYCILNSVALERCGGSAHDGSSSSAGIVYGTDTRIARAIPPLSDDELEIGLRAANEEFLSCGVTSIQDTSWSNRHRHWQALRTFRERGLLTLRIAMLAGIDAVDEFVRSGLKTGAGDDFLRLGAAKLALDESTGNDDPPQGDLNELAMIAHLAGFQLAFHVSDANLLRKSLRALDFIENHTGKRCLRPRFEHCPLCPPSLLPEIAEKGAIVVSQPNLLRQFGSSYPNEASEEQLRWLFPYRSYASAGIQLAFSSDTPLTSCDPLLAIDTATTRCIGGGRYLGQDEAISLVQALRMSTCSGAYCSNEETLKGSLAPGLFADLAVLECDGDQLVIENIPAAKVILTLLDGKVVWSR